MHFGERVFDGELVKVKDVGQQPPLDFFRLVDVHPEDFTRLREEPRGIDAIDLAGHAVAVDKDREHGVIMLSQKFEARSQKSGRLSMDRAR